MRSIVVVIPAILLDEHVGLREIQNVVLSETLTSHDIQDALDRVAVRGFAQSTGFELRLVTVRRLIEPDRGVLGAAVAPDHRGQAGRGPAATEVRGDIVRAESPACVRPQLSRV